MEKIKIAVVTGPTASGKTTLAAALAKKYNGEVISADSMQIYKDIPVATAQPTEEEMNGVFHHLIGFQPLNKPFSVAQYVNKAREMIFELNEKGVLPFIAGGTGLYISSLLNGITFSPAQSDDALRQELLNYYDKNGGEKMLSELAEFDPQTAANLHSNDKMRITRAFEVYRLTGIPISEHAEHSRPDEEPYNACVIGLDCKKRDYLYQRINRRVDIMLENGLLDEVTRVMSLDKSATAVQAIGCKEFFPYIKGEITLDEAVSMLKQNTRRYAKRQLTWFRRDDRVNWIYFDENTSFEEIFKDSEKILVKYGIV